MIYSALATPEGEVSQVFQAKSNIQFLAPDFLIEEIRGYLEDIAVPRAITKRKVTGGFQALLDKIIIISKKDIPKECVLKAFEIVKEIDPDDFFFVALHLYAGHKIWTGDRELINGLRKKGLDICVTTSQLKKILYK